MKWIQGKLNLTCYHNGKKMFLVTVREEVVKCNNNVLEPYVNIRTGKCKIVMVQIGDDNYRPLPRPFNGRFNDYVLYTDFHLSDCHIDKIEPY